MLTSASAASVPVYNQHGRVKKMKERGVRDLWMRKVRVRRSSSITTSCTHVI